MENRQKSRNAGVKFLYVVVILVLMWLFVFDFSHTAIIHGRIIDATTGEPISGALIVSKWEGSWCYGFVKSKTIYAKHFAKSNEKGEFELPGIRPYLSWGPLLKLKNQQIAVYHPRYKPSQQLMTYKQRLNPLEKRDSANIAASRLLLIELPQELLKAEPIKGPELERILRHYVVAFDPGTQSYIVQAAKQGLEFRYPLLDFMPTWEAVFEPIATDMRLGPLWKRIKYRFKKAEYRGNFQVPKPY